jgi:hypothetical protein
MDGWGMDDGGMDDGWMEDGGWLDLGWGWMVNLDFFGGPLRLAVLRGGGALQLGFDEGQKFQWRHSIHVTD